MKKLFKKNDKNAQETIEKTLMTKHKDVSDNLLLEVKNLRVYFKTKNKFVNIVRGVDLSIERGQIIGIVGESGSGKSVTTKSLLDINFNMKSIADEAMIYPKDGAAIDLNKLKDFTKIRGSKIAYIPQDPMSALNPTRKIWKQINDVLLLFRKDLKTKEQRFKYMIELLEKFGIRNSEHAIKQYPHVFSGGMKQRVVIAMTVAAHPDLIIADEPTTALDTTVQASVLELLETVRRDYNMSIFFISHNIAVVAKFVDYIYVMYAGKVVEKGTKIDILTNPLHPYTWALLSALPDDMSKKLLSIPGQPPNIADLPFGDPFAPRNKYALEIDFKKEPPLIQVSATHFGATWLLHPDAPKIALPEKVQDVTKMFKNVFKKDQKSTKSKINKSKEQNVA